jgi:rhodanese-related sulfurtransferase
MSVQTISPTEVSEANRKGVHPEIIDVRTAAEFEEVHAEGARLVPLDHLDAKAVLRGRTGPTDAPLYFLCKSGTRGAKACELLAAAGFNNAINIEGGTMAWEKAGLPVVRGKKTMSLERQVRIMAGSLVVIGIALGRFVHPIFLLLSAFIGGGLVFAGITDSCGMGMLLAKMPWNQRASRGASA